MKSEYNDLSEEEIEKIVESIEDKILEQLINLITGGTWTPSAAVTRTANSTICTETKDLAQT
jgi:hypothetical protein